MLDNKNDNNNNNNNEATFAPTFAEFGELDMAVQDLQLQINDLLIQFESQFLIPIDRVRICRRDTTDYYGVVTQLWKESSHLTSPISHIELELSENKLVSPIKLKIPMEDKRNQDSEPIDNGIEEDPERIERIATTGEVVQFFKEVAGGR